MLASRSPFLCSAFAAVVLLALGVGLCATAAEMPMPSLKVPLVPGAAPKVDGVLDDAIWKQAAEATDFRLGEGGPAQGKTRLLVARDAQNLYVAVECFEEAKALASLTADAKEHDADAIWQDDDVELFIDPTGQRKSYYQIIANSRGVTWDAFHSEPSSPDTTWEPKYQCAAKVGKASWTVEFALPFTIFDRTKTAADAWPFNVLHGRQAAAETCYWSPVLAASAHTPGRFGTLTAMPGQPAQTGAAPAPAPRVAAAASPQEKMVFDFEDEAEVKAWSNNDVYALREAEAKAAYDAALKSAPDPTKVAPYKPLVQPAKEPPVKIEWTTEGVSSGKHAMKLTFAGGRIPTIATKPAADDWRTYKSLQVSVTAPRTCMVVFRVMAETSKYGVGYNDGCSRWEFAARCEAGKNTLVTPLTWAWARSDAVWSGIKSFEIYMYNPREGESIIVDGISLSTAQPKASSQFNDALSTSTNKYYLPAGKYKVLGTNLEVKDVDELADMLKDKWTKPEDKTVDQHEADFRAQYEAIRKDHPKAVLVTLRDGQKGYDAANPDKAFVGWQDSGTPSHLPMALTLACFTNSGKSEDIETCFRNRPGFLRVDLSSIPKGAEILGAKLIVARGVGMGDNWATKPTMLVVEPCRRPWKEYEVNVFEYAKDSFWNEYAGETWGEGGDCDAVLLAHGPASGVACAWDFAEAVRWWTGGQHENNGFILYGSPKYVDYLHVCTREHAKIANRPAVMVIYELK